jgi:hypothetical protein
MPVLWHQWHPTKNEHSRRGIASVRALRPDQHQTRLFAAHFHPQRSGSLSITNSEPVCLTKILQTGFEETLRRFWVDRRLTLPFRITEGLLVTQAVSASRPSITDASNIGNETLIP